MRVAWITGLTALLGIGGSPGCAAPGPQADKSPRPTAHSARPAGPKAASPSGMPPARSRATAGPAFPKDAVLRQLERDLPKPWRLVRRKDTFIIQGDLPFWTVACNRINAPVGYLDNCRAQWRRRRAKTPPTLPRFVYRYGARWSAQEIARVRQWNAPIEAKLAAIRKSITNRWKRGWEQWRNRSFALTRRLKRLPYQTPRHSIFLVRKTGVEDNLTVVFPQKAARAIWQVSDLVDRTLRPYQLR